MLLNLIFQNKIMCKFTSVVDNRVWVTFIFSLSSRLIQVMKKYMYFMKTCHELCNTVYCVIFTPCYFCLLQLQMHKLLNLHSKIIANMPRTPPGKHL